MTRIEARSDQNSDRRGDGKTSVGREPPGVLLAIAHPGHELFVHGWLEQTRPLVAILTDGSGRNRLPRIGVTSRILQQSQATPATFFGVYPDRRVYEAILQRDDDFFLTIARSLEKLIVAARIEVVVGDAAEGAILVHDVWRAMIDAAIVRVRRRHDWPIANFEFAIEGSPKCERSRVEATDAISRTSTDSSLICKLSEAAVARKLAVARDYDPLRADVDALLEHRGSDWLQNEQLTAVHVVGGAVFDHLDPLPYELHGRQLVQAGVYLEAIEFRRHVRPLLQRLHDWSEVA